jgi:hypothetical protein
MLARLGDVLYWAASLIAVLILAFGAWTMMYRAPTENTDYITGLVVFGGYALLVLLIGRACRYVLSGR